MKLKPDLTEQALEMISKERDRQDAKWKLQRHTPEKWLTIIMEEVGEMAQAIQKGDIQHKLSDADDLLTETIQAAACCVELAEQLLEAKKEVCADCPDPSFCRALWCGKTK
jgi:NTP pyrophosphatase (non-canonical NTP hydrolase)